MRIGTWTVVSRFAGDSAAARYPGAVVTASQTRSQPLIHGHGLSDTVTASLTHGYNLKQLLVLFHSPGHVWLQPPLLSP